MASRAVVWAHWMAHHMVQFCCYTMFLAIGEVGQLGKWLYNTIKKWLQPRQVNVQAKNYNENLEFVLPQYNNHTTCVLPNNNFFSSCIFTIFYFCIQFFTFYCFNLGPSRAA